MIKQTASQKVLAYLATVEEASPSQIYKGTKLHPYLLKFVLEDLEIKGKIIVRIKELSTQGNYKYYSLKRRKK